MQSEFITAAAAASKLGIDRRSMNRLCREGRFSAKRDDRFHWLVSVDEVEDYKETRGQYRGRQPAEYEEVIKKVAETGMKYRRCDVLQLCSAIRSGKKFDRKTSAYYSGLQRPLLELVIELLFPKYKRHASDIVRNFARTEADADNLSRQFMNDLTRDVLEAEQ